VRLSTFGEMGERMPRGTGLGWLTSRRGTWRCRPTGGSSRRGVFGMSGRQWSSWVVCFRSFSVGDGASVGVESDSERVFKVDFNGVQRTPRSFASSAGWGDCARGGVSRLEKDLRIVVSSLNVGFIAAESRRVCVYLSEGVATLRGAERVARPKHGGIMTMQESRG
jgi:hypothetical protein